MKLGQQNIQADAAVLNTMLGKFIFLLAPLTSTDWDGDAYSTTAKTKIDLSAVFSGVPAGVRAVLARLSARDSGSAGGTTWIILSPNDTNDEGLGVSLSGHANDAWIENCITVPCDSAGDIYYEIVATDTNTLDVVLQIWGYWI